MSASGRHGTPARPLDSLRIAVTRPAADADELARLLEAYGACPVLIPLSAIAPPVDDSAFRRSAARLDEYDWIVFTSVNGVRALAAVASWEGTAARIAAVGPATAEAVRALGGSEPELVPEPYTGAALAAAMLEHGSMRGAHVLWPRAEQSGDDLPCALRDAGAFLDDPVAYRTVTDGAAAAELARMDEQGEIDVITFTAPSAINAFADAVSGPVHTRIAVIGPVTAAAARARGLRVHVEAEQHIISALVAALARFHSRGSP